MFCPECGANLPDGTVFCSECGTSVGAPQPAAPQQYAPQYAAPVYYGTPGNLSKKEYIKQLATPSAKKASSLALILLAACILVMVIGHISMMNNSIEDIPILSLALKIEDVDMDEFDEIKDNLSDALDEMESEFEDYEDDFEDMLSKKELKKLEEFFDVMKDCTKTFSISNVQKMADLMVDLADTDAAELLDLDDDLEDFEEAVEIIDLAATVLLVASLCTLLFTVIGGLCRVRGLVIFGAIGPTIFCALMYGFLFVALILAAHIGLIIMLGKVNKEYKAYRNGTLPMSA